MATYSSVSANISSQQTKTANSINKYINIKNAVKILSNYSNWNGYIKLYTEVQSNFDVGDIVYITYTSPIGAVTNFNLENPDTPYSEWFNGYTVLYTNKEKNEIVINREYNDITTGKVLLDQYLSRVSIRSGTFTGGVIDGLVFYNADIYSGVSFTQGVFKYCNISNITFNDKWTNVKVLYTTNTYTSKFTAKKSSTATTLKSKRYYYNVIDNCNLINCNVKNGKFENSTLIGITGSSYINDGYFYNCVISGYTINGGYFYDCEVEANCNWNYGYWSSTGGTDDFRADWINGVWNKGNFIGKVWSGGTFNTGTFSASTWVDGVVNSGNFYHSTWLNGLVRSANFYYSTWQNGTYNQGYIYNSTWNNGTFNNGTFEMSTYLSGLTNGGIFTGSTINGGKWYGGNLKDVTINNGSFYQDYLIHENSDISYAKIHNGNVKNSTISDGKYYNGYYENVTLNGSDIIIYNGQYKSCSLTDLTVLNGNFIECTADNVTWKGGIFTEGYFERGYWYNGTWNDSTFYSEVFAGGDFYGGYFSGDTSSPPDTGWSATWSGGTFHYGYWKGVYRTSLPIYPYPKWNYSQQANTTQTT